MASGLIRNTKTHIWLGWKYDSLGIVQTKTEISPCEPMVYAQPKSRPRVMAKEFLGLQNAKESPIQVRITSLNSNKQEEFFLHHQCRCPSG